MSDSKTNFNEDMEDSISMPLEEKCWVGEFAGGSFPFGREVVPYKTYRVDFSDKKFCLQTITRRDFFCAQQKRPV